MLNFLQSAGEGDQDSFFPFPTRYLSEHGGNLSASGGSLVRGGGVIDLFVKTRLYRVGL